MQIELTPLEAYVILSGIGLQNDEGTWGNAQSALTSNPEHYVEGRWKLVDGKPTCIKEPEYSDEYVTLADSKLPRDISAIDLERVLIPKLLPLALEFAKENQNDIQSYREKKNAK